MMYILYINFLCMNIYRFLLNFLKIEFLKPFYNITLFLHYVIVFFYKMIYILYMFSNSKLKLLQSFFDIFVVVCLSQKFVQSANIIFCISIRKRKHNLSFWHFNAFTKTVFSRLLLLKRHRLIELEEILFLFSKPHKLIVMVPSELLAINPWFEFCQDKKKSYCSKWY